MPDSDYLRRRIAENGAILFELYRPVFALSRGRKCDPEKQALWLKAQEAFGAHYETLRFPGGYNDNTLEFIIDGNGKAMETALCFLEVRPAFPDSGKMFRAILRACKKAPLSPAQADRLRIVIKEKDARDVLKARGMSTSEDA